MKKNKISMALTAGAFLTFLSFPFQIQAQGAPDTFEECAEVPDDVERLACYDEVASATVPDTIKRMREAKAEQGKREFGLFKPSPGQVLDELQVEFVSISKNPFGKVVLRTKDGQVWQQTDSRSVYWRDSISGTIKKGAMGSYFFSPDGKGRTIKVERIK